jgi:hypothetical protein
LRPPPVAFARPEDAAGVGVGRGLDRVAVAVGRAGTGRTGTGRAGAVRAGTGRAGACRAGAGRGGAAAAVAGAVAAAGRVALAGRGVTRNSSTLSQPSRPSLWCLTRYRVPPPRGFQAMTSTSIPSLSVPTADWPMSSVRVTRRLELPGQLTKTRRPTERTGPVLRDGLGDIGVRGGTNGICPPRRSRSGGRSSSALRFDPRAGSRDAHPPEPSRQKQIPGPPSSS